MSEDSDADEESSESEELRLQSDGRLGKVEVSSSESAHGEVDSLSEADGNDRSNKKGFLMGSVER